MIFCGLSAHVVVRMVLGLHGILDGVDDGEGVSEGSKRDYITEMLHKSVVFIHDEKAWAQ